MKIIPLSEGSFTIDKTKVFVPYEEDQHQLNDRPTGSLLVEVQPFLVVTSKDVLLLDTGLGFSKNGSLQIHDNLRQHGYEPAHISKVLMTHLHKDHAGGVSFKDRLGHYSLAFPQAIYYVQRQELDYAFETGFPSFMTDEIDMLQNNSRVVLLEGDGTIDNYIRYQLTSGHSPFHQVFWIEEEGETIFFGGDEAPQLGQMRRSVIAKYDHDGRRANDLRKQWWEQGQQENWKFLFYHDVKRPVWPEEAVS
ncbi:MBL fold metallo-hydrolase [Aridibaculum aurantiacum]|uniref:MBL fold metallo-hydrolase n=1 Tax=Aridibaculum aurantiacum TaxID=2810307 RepID=UPI001A96DDF7|nr:MBL fold metallo-hydrolase [Aridibaculum aurantiacum]